MKNSKGFNLQGCMLGDGNSQEGDLEANSRDDNLEEGTLEVIDFSQTKQARRINLKEGGPEEGKPT